MSKSGKYKEKLKAEVSLKKEVIEKTKNKEAQRKIKDLKNVDWNNVQEEDYY